MTLYHDELTDDQLKELKLRRQLPSLKRKQSVDTRAKALSLRRSDPTCSKYSDADIARICGVSRMRIYQIFTDRFNRGDGKYPRKPQTWIKSRYRDEEWYKLRKKNKKEIVESPWVQRRRRKKKEDTNL